MLQRLQYYYVKQAGGNDSNALKHINDHYIQFNLLSFERTKWNLPKSGWKRNDVSQLVFGKL